MNGFSATYKWMKSKIPASALSKMSKWKWGTAHSVGLYTWPTKSYEFWMILQSLLYLVRPRILVEFGAGRSTCYLAEYALKYKATLISFEQHFLYYLKFSLGLKFTFLPKDVMRYVPLKGDWYDVEKVQKYLAEVPKIDFFFYDGPATPTRGDRNSYKFEEHVLPRLNGVKLVVVDDVHRAKELRIAEGLAQKFDLNMFILQSSCDNSSIAILVAKDFVTKIDLLPEFQRKLLVRVR